MLLAEAQTLFFGPVLTQFPEKVGEHIFLDLLALVAVLRELLPDVHETGEIVFEMVNYIVCGKVVVLELLDDDKDEQVQHHMRTKQHDQVEVPEPNWPSLSTSLSLDAAIGAIWSPVTVVHDFVPVFTCGESKHQEEGVEEAVEVLVHRVNYVASFDGIE